jgi:fibronectin type 3 domain-containing protein
MNFSALGTSTSNSYVDTAAVIGTAYYYTVQSVNISGSSPSSPVVGPLVPAPTGEMSLASLRLASQQKADRINSQFVTTQEWNTFINLAMNELYDLLITTYEDYFMAPRIQFIAPGNT